MSLLLLPRLWKVLMKDNDDGTEFVSLPKKFIYAVLYTRQMGVITKGFTNESLWVASSSK